VNAWPGFSFDAKLTLDGLMTLAGGVIAFLAVLLQNRNTRIQVDRQLAAEREARAEEARARSRAVGVAILFEIDHFYRFYIQDVMSLLERRTEAKHPVVIKAPAPMSFPVYFGNCSHLGDLPGRLVEAVVHFYGIAQGYVSELRERAQIYEVGIRDGSPRALEFPEALLPRVQKHCEALVPLAFLTCGLLCAYVDETFETPTVAVADDRHVTEERCEFLRIGVGQLRTPGGAR